MTIRKTLLLAFVVVSLVPATILTYVAYAETRQVLEQEIQSGLESRAADATAEIDHMLFERLQNAQSWSRLHVMQDIRIGDIDKRLSQFLTEVKTGYSSVYGDLYCVDRDGKVVASSNAALIGATAPATRHWLQVQVNNGSVDVEHLITDAASGRQLLPLKIAIVSDIDGALLGQLVLLFEWSQVNRILDQAADNGRSAILIDQERRAIATSSNLYGADLSANGNVATWPPPSLHQTIDLLTPLTGSTPNVIASFDRSHGFEHFAGFGWITLIMQPSSLALAPVQRMEYMFAALLATTAMLAVAISSIIAARIARPIVRLTNITRRFARGHKLPPRPQEGRGEVGELSQAFFTMVHDLERSRQDFTRAAKLAAAGEIAASIGHEIRTPLGILRSSAQILRQETGLSDEGRELIGYIESETDRINRLLRGLLDSASPHAPQFARTDLRQIVQASTGMLSAPAEKKGITIEQSFDDGDLTLECDAQQLTQILLNLLLNAIHVLDHGGRIEIQCHRQADSLQIEVGDSGPGIAEEQRQRIFEPFYSTRRGGLGLGLPIVKHIVSTHQGSISIGSSRLGGALFTIQLPIHTDSAP